MSYWVDIEDPKTGQSLDESVNHTFNTFKMMAEVLQTPEGIKAIHGKEGREVSSMLHDGFVTLAQRPEDFRHLNAPNG